MKVTVHNSIVGILNHVVYVVWAKEGFILGAHKVMFSFGRRDEVVPTHQVLKLSLSSPKAGDRQSNRRTSDRKNHWTQQKRNDDPRLQRMNVHDTTDGVEVSIDFFKGGGDFGKLAFQGGNLPIKGVTEAPGDGFGVGL